MTAMRTSKGRDALPSQAQAVAHPNEPQTGPRQEYTRYLREHFKTLTTEGLANGYGSEAVPMWMSSLDVRTGRYPADDRRPAHIGKRVYRNIDAPGGCSLYWDQPSVVAAHRLARECGDDGLARAADAYVAAFLRRCVGTTGLFLWGNHYFYDARRGCVVWFADEEDPQPVDARLCDGSWHEVRPLMPAWETFWRVSPAATEACIRAMCRWHLVDDSGDFNRHADKRSSHAFLEAGGILAESFCWLGRQVADSSLVEQALSIARFSFRHRHPETGLLPVSPMLERWDKHCCTSEVGHWALSMLHCADYTDRSEFAQMAEAAVRAYLRYAYDGGAGKYLGRVRITDGAALREPLATPYAPGEFSDLWQPLFPTHDYPAHLAGACLALWRRTGDPFYRQAVLSWPPLVAASTPRRTRRIGYAEHYGRWIGFLAEAGRTLGNEKLLQQARDLADEAIGQLWAGRLFRGHSGEDRYDAVDGVGILALGLMDLR